MDLGCSTGTLQGHFTPSLASAFPGHIPSSSLAQKHGWRKQERLRGDSWAVWNNEAVSTLGLLKSILCFGGKPFPAASCCFLLWELWECVAVEAGKLLRS